MSSDVPALDSGYSGDKSITCSDFVVSVNNDMSIEYKRMYSASGTTEGLVGVSKSKIPMELEMAKCGSLPVSLRIVISASIRGLFQVPGALVCNGCYGM